MGGFWAFLSDPDNQRTLAWLGGGLMVLAGGIWTVVTFFAGRKPSPAAPSEPDPGKVTAVGGVAAGRDLRARDITIAAGSPSGPGAGGEADRR